MVQAVEVGRLARARWLLYHEPKGRGDSLCLQGEGGLRDIPSRATCKDIIWKEGMTLPGVA